jgi:phosphate-selective porin OprO/OprP
MIRYTGHAVLAAALSMLAGGTAAAQSAPAEAPPPSPAPEAPPPEAPPAAAPTPAPAAPADVGPRLDEIDQIARVAARKQEIFEEALAAKAKEAPSVTADDNGFSIRSADRAYLLRIRAQVQTDGRFFAGNDAYEANDTFLVRRFRPGVDGTLFSLVDYRMVADFAGGTVQIMEGYVDLHPWECLRLRTGKFKGTIGLERLQGDADLPLFERALDMNLSSQREFGVNLWGNVAGVVTYVVGIVNGAPDDTNPDTADLNHGKDFQGRLFIQPFRVPGLERLGNLGVGVSASTGNRKGRLPVAVNGSPVPVTPAATGLGPYKTAGQNTFFSYYAPTNDTTGALTTFGNGRASHLDPQLFYYIGPFGLLAEIVWSRQAVQRGNNTAVLTNKAAHGTASFVIGGREGYDGPTPTHPFDPAQGQWGALELAAQLSWLKVDPLTFGDPNVPGSTAYADPTKSAQSATAWGVNAAWVPRRSLHLGVLYERTKFEGGAGTTMAITDRPTENLVLGRAQVNF